MKITMRYEDNEVYNTIDDLSSFSFSGVDIEREVIGAMKMELLIGSITEVAEIFERSGPAIDRTFIIH